MRRETLTTDCESESEDQTNMQGKPLPPRVAAKIREIAIVLAAATVALKPSYDFCRSNLASSDLSIDEIMCRAAALSNALGSMRRNSTSC